MSSYPDWITWVLALSVLAGALSIIIRRIVRPLLRVMIVAEDITPVLRQIANDFPNGNLKSTIGEMSAQLATNTRAIDNLRKTMESHESLHS